VIKSMKTIQLDKLIQMIAKEVTAELKRHGVQVVYGDLDHSQNVSVASEGSPKIEQIDMSRFKTPVLTSSQLNRLHGLTKVIMVPKTTIITFNARRIIREKQLKIEYET